MHVIILLWNNLENHLSRIENILKRELDLYSWSEFYAPLIYACDGGKRIRPLIFSFDCRNY